MTSWLDAQIEDQDEKPTNHGLAKASALDRDGRCASN